jgi:hypothetical protein
MGMVWVRPRADQTSSAAAIVKQAQRQRPWVVLEAVRKLRTDIAEMEKTGNGKSKNTGVSPLRRAMKPHGFGRDEDSL